MEMTERKTWREFQSAGLLWFVNTILQVFGWSIVFELDEDRTNGIEVYPVRTKFRGFSDDSVRAGHIALAEYLKKNVKDLREEAYL